jgi:biopolymer transport protein ExbD
MRRPLFRRSTTGGSGEVSTAALAPMVDIFTILLIVLLRSWSQDPPIDMVEAGFQLPLSSTESPTGRGVAVDVAAKGLYVEGWRTGSSEFWAESEDVLITEVYEALQVRGGSRVEIRAHKDAPWSLVGKVLYTAQQAGYSDVELVAVSRSSL